MLAIITPASWAGLLEESSRQWRMGDKLPDSSERLAVAKSSPDRSQVAHCAESLTHIIWPAIEAALRIFERLLVLSASGGACKR